MTKLFLLPPPALGRNSIASRPFSARPPLPSLLFFTWAATTFSSLSRPSRSGPAQSARAPLPPLAGWRTSRAVHMGAACQAVAVAGHVPVLPRMRACRCTVPPRRALPRWLSPAMAAHAEPGVEHARRLSPTSQHCRVTATIMTPEDPRTPPRRANHRLLRPVLAAVVSLFPGARSPARRGEHAHCLACRAIPSPCQIPTSQAAPCSAHCSGTIIEQAAHGRRPISLLSAAPAPYLCHEHALPSIITRRPALACSRCCSRTRTHMGAARATAVSSSALLPPPLVMPST